MQLAALQIVNFKGLPELTVSLANGQGLPRSITLVLGDNGSGKTSLLQAVTLAVGMATRRLEDPSALQWPEFLPERMSTLGPTRVELDVVVTADELEYTAQLHAIWSSQVRPELARAVATPSRVGAVPRLGDVFWFD